MKKVVAGLAALALLVAVESNALISKKTLTVFNVNTSGAPARISVTYNDPCEHWNDTVEKFAAHEARCGWKQFDAWIQLPSGEVQADGLTYSALKAIDQNDVVVIYGPVGGKYYAKRTTN